MVTAQPDPHPQPLSLQGLRHPCTPQGAGHGAQVKGARGIGLSSYVFG